MANKHSPSCSYRRNPPADTGEGLKAAAAALPEYVTFAPDSEPSGATGISLTRYCILVTVGAFATTFARWVLAQYLTNFLLKNQAHCFPLC